MKHYYLNLPKNKKLDLEFNERISDGIYHTARRAFEPFETYLKNTIEALQKKEDITAHWKKIKADNIAELKLIGKVYEIPNKVGRYRIIADVEDFDFDESIIYKYEGKKGKNKITQADIDAGQIYLEGVTAREFDSVTWSGETIELQPLWNDGERFEGIVIREEAHRKLLYAENGQKPSPEATEIRKLVSFIDFDHIYDGSNHSIKATRNEGLNVTLTNIEDFDKTVQSNQLKFKLKKTTSRSKEAYWIQLVEINDNISDDVPGFSPLKYFFDDGIEIEDEKGNKYQVAAGKESENQLILKQGRKFCFPPEGSKLSVKINTYQLKKQQEAIRTLLQMPVGEQGKLIRLFEDKDKARWEHPKQIVLDNWHILTDENRSGSTEQREFVEKAINTSDFAILEGPPGSGKTTVILELICQLAQQGKRVLLCGSTHVAIDNVLDSVVTR